MLEIILLDMELVVRWWAGVERVRIPRLRQRASRRRREQPRLKRDERKAKATLCVVVEQAGMGYTCDAVRGGKREGSQLGGGRGGWGWCVCVGGGDSHPREGAKGNGILLIYTFPSVCAYPHAAPHHSAHASPHPVPSSPGWFLPAAPSQGERQAHFCLL